MNSLENTISNIKRPDIAFAQRTQKRLDSLTKPQGSLGRLEELAKQIVMITEKENPCLKNKVIFTMAGDHGVTDEGVSAFPKEVTPQMVYNFLNRGAGINVLAALALARVVIVDMGVASDLEKHPDLIIKKIGYGTKNMAKGPAMTTQEAIRSIESGIEAFEQELSKGIDLIGTGDMGIGNTTASSAITAVITGADIESVTGRGTGIDDKSLDKKIKAIKKAIEINSPDRDDAIDILSKVGGFEIGGIAGVILAACSNKVPVLIDGFISGAGALIAYKLQPHVKDYMIASHLSIESGHKAVLDYIGLKPLLNLDLRLGEGTGAALAMNIVEASVRILTEMASFKEAGVSERNKK